MDFMAPDTNAGNNPTLLNDFLQYRRQKQQQDLDFTKNLADFQSNLRLNELARQMNLQKELMPPEQAPVGNRSPMSAFGGVRFDPYAADKIAQGQEKIDNQNRQAQDKNKIAQDAMNVKETAEGKKESDAEKFANKQTLQTEAEGARSNLQNTLQDKKSTAAINLEDRKQTGRTANIKQRGQQLLDQIAAKGKEARATKNAPSPNFSANLPSQQLIQHMNDAQQFINENPDLGKFVKIDPNTKNVTVKQPSAPSFFGGSGGPTQEQYQQILDKLYPQKTTVTMGQQPNTTVQPTHIKVTDGRGGTYMWDTSKGDIPQGYTAVPSTSGSGGGNDEENQ